MRIRIVVSLAVVLFALSLSAQGNEVGVFLNAPKFQTTSVTDPDIGSVKLVFDGKTGFGVAIDHFMSPDMAAHFSAQRLRATSRLEFADQGGISVDTGTMDLTEFTAALHWYFLSRGMVRPYAGAGVARIQGAKLHIPAQLTESGGEETVSLDSKTTWTADAGIDIHVGRNGTITASAQYTPYKTQFGAAPDDPLQSMKLNPLTFAAGFRWRF